MGAGLSNVKTALLCAGGTGGHMFPAQALCEAFLERGWAVHLVTDDRGLRYSDAFPQGHVHVVPSATFASKNPLSVVKTGWTLFSGYRASRRLIRQIGADVCVGFGGYPTVPPMMAATHLGVPTVLHEQNAVLGRANALLARRAKVVAAGFEGATLPKGTVITGNPLRPAVIESAKRLRMDDQFYKPSHADEPFELLIFGGSQGATFFGDTVPEALALMSPKDRARLRLTLQVRPESVASVVQALSGLVEGPECAPFFKDMPQRMERSHLVIARAGASTVSEIAALGRPSVLVPYPHALDHDQAANAALLVRDGGGIVIPQRELSSQAFADLVSAAMSDPNKLAGQARAAAQTARLDATEVLADLVESAVKQV